MDSLLHRSKAMQLDQSISDQIADTEDHMMIFDKFAAAALTGVPADCSADSAAQTAMETALELMRLRHCYRDRIKMANHGITPDE